MEYPKIAVAMIVRGVAEEAPLLANALASLNGYVDDFYIGINAPKGQKIASKVRVVAEQYTDPGNIFVSEWVGNFAGARNTIFSKVPKKYDWIMWIDSDDVVDNPERIRDIISICSKQTEGIFLKYDYAHDEFGNTTVSHWVCRIVRNNGTFLWKSSFDDEEVTVHETLCEVRAVSKVMNDEVKIIHHSNSDRMDESLQRNLALLDGMYERQQRKGSIDPRISFYLGTHCYDARMYGRAKVLLQEYMQLSGWAEERSEALVYLGNIYKLEGKHEQAKHAYLLATGENPNNQRAYIELGEMEYLDKRFVQSIDWLDKALECKKPKTTVVLFPMENTFKAYMFLAQSHVNLGGKNLDEAYKYIQKALQLRSLDLDAQNARDLIEKLIRVRDETKAAMRLISSLDKEGQNENILKLLDLLPTDLQDSPAVLTARHKYIEPKKWSKRSIAIYVGPGPLGTWGPWSLKDGISGSEEAIIQLSNLLAQKGWQVTMFATPGDRAGQYDRDNKCANLTVYAASALPNTLVDWKQYWEFNPKDEYDVLIGWRSPWFFDGEFKARKTYLWLHDVIDKPELTEGRLSKITKVIFVSQYHADLFKDVVPEDKIFVSGNGIDPKQFEKYDGVERDPYKCVYTSAHERGLKILYDIWPEVKKAVPQATLDVYYGWDGYDAINRDNPERMQWKAGLVKQEKTLKELGVIDHGRVGHDEIAKAMSSAGVFAYPCTFPEVYCISAIKAQAAGCDAVTSDFAVLDEYNELGCKVHLDTKDYQKFKDDYTEALIIELREKIGNDIQDDWVKELREKFSWEKTAEGWSEEMA